MILVNIIKWSLISSPLLRVCSGVDMSWDVFTRVNPTNLVTGSNCTSYKVTQENENDVTVIECARICFEYGWCYNFSYTEQHQCIICLTEQTSVSKYHLVRYSLDSGLQYESYQTRMPIFYTVKLSWQDAKSVCHGINRELLTLYTPSDLSKLRHMVGTSKLIGVCNDLWLSGTKLSGLWAWHDGVLMDSSLWAPGEPENFNCSHVLMDPNLVPTRRFKLNDTPCTNSLCFACS